MIFKNPVRAEHAFPPTTGSLYASCLVASSLFASSFRWRPSRGSGATPRVARPGGGERLASLGGASLRSAWLSSAGAYPIRVCCILAVADNLGSQTIICVVRWSSLRSNSLIGTLDDQARQKSLWHISVSARCYIRSVWQLLALKLLYW